MQRAAGRMCFPTSTVQRSHCPRGQDLRLPHHCRASSASALSHQQQTAEPPLLISSPSSTPGLRVVDLHRPHAHNALNMQMVQTLLPLVQDWQQASGDVKLVVLRGSGPISFCSKC